MLTPRLATTLAVLSAIGCNDKPPAGQQTPSTQSAATVRVPSATGSADPFSDPPPSAARQRVSATVLSRICKESPCTGRFARIEMFANPKGTVELLYYHSDIERCSHGPSIYFDPTGKKLDTIPNKPMDPKSDRGKELLALHAKHHRGRTKAGVHSCQ